MNRVARMGACLAMKIPNPSTARQEAVRNEKSARLYDGNGVRHEKDSTKLDKGKHPTERVTLRLSV